MAVARADWRGFVRVEELPVLGAKSPGPDSVRISALEKSTAGLEARLESLIAFVKNAKFGFLHQSEGYGPEAAADGLKRVRSDTAGDGALLSERQMKRARKAERDRLKKGDIPTTRRDTSKEVCKFGDTCREFLKSGKCGYLHRL